MAWTDVKTELDKVETAITSLGTVADGTSISDSLDRTDASAIRKKCMLLMDKLMEIDARASEEQELPPEKVLRNSVTDIQKAKDVVEKKNFDKDGWITSTVFTSEQLKKRATITKVYDDSSGAKIYSHSTYLVEDVV